MTKLADDGNLRTDLRFTVRSSTIFLFTVLPANPSSIYHVDTLSLNPPYMAILGENNRENIVINPKFYLQVIKNYCIMVQINAGVAISPSPNRCL